MLSGMLLMIAFIPTPHDKKLTLEGDMQIKDWKKEIHHLKFKDKKFSL